MATNYDRVSFTHLPGNTASHRDINIRGLRVPDEEPVCTTQVHDTRARLRTHTHGLSLSRARPSTARAENVSESCCMPARPVVVRRLRPRHVPALTLRRGLLDELLACGDLGGGLVELGLEGIVLRLQRRVLVLHLAQRLLQDELVLPPRR